MSQELIINDTLYMSGTSLSRKFLYTSDYLGKLAREGKVEAVQVGRNWFLSEESLKDFVEQSVISKEKRRMDLRVERKNERDIAVRKNKEVTVCVQTDMNVSVFHSIALAKTVVLASCISLLIFLGGTMYQEGVDTQILTEASAETFSIVASAISPSFEMSGVGQQQLASINFTLFFRWLFGYGEIDEFYLEQDIISPNTQATKNIKSDQNIYKNALILSPATSTTTIKDIRSVFSDEVEVEFDGPGTGVITPIFRKKSDEEYRFILVPVSRFSE